MMSEKRGGAGCFSSVIRYFVVALLSVALIRGLSGGLNLIHRSNNTQRQADISLNEYIDQEKAFPEDEYVSLELRWVIGPYAEETSTMSSGYSEEGFTTGVDYYYYAILEDWTVMTIKAANSAEVARLDSMSEWLLGVEGYPTDGETITLQGTLKPLKDQDVLAIFKEHLSIFGLSETDSEVRYLMLDTNAGRETLYIGVAVAVVGVIAAVMLYKNVRKRRDLKRQIAEQEALRSAMEQAEQAEQNAQAVQHMMQAKDHHPDKFPDPE